MRTMTAVITGLLADVCRLREAAQSLGSSPRADGGAAGRRSW
jgi:hypothetical protein